MTKKELFKIDEIINQNKHECPHCKFLCETFLEDTDPYSGERDFCLMTDVFVYLHGGDECNYFRKGNKCLK